jgi:hypothetical protein
VALGWSVKLIAEGQPDGISEVEVGRMERDHRCTVGNLGLTLAEGKEILAAIQRETGRPPSEACWCCVPQLPGLPPIAGHHGLLSCNVSLVVRRRASRRAAACGVRLSISPPADFSRHRPRKRPIGPEVLLITAKYAALFPFDLLPCANDVNASTVRNRTIAIWQRLLRAGAGGARPNRSILTTIWSSSALMAHMCATGIRDPSEISRLSLVNLTGIYEATP